MIGAAAFAYVMCAAVSGTAAGLLYRSWRRSRARLVMWAAAAFGILTLSNILLVADLFLAADLSLPRAGLVALGLGVLIYGVAWEEQQS